MNKNIAFRVMSYLNEANKFDDETIRTAIDVICHERFIVLSSDDKQEIQHFIKTAQKLLKEIK